MARKPVTIHYRRFSDSAMLGGVSLEEAVRNAMDTRDGGIRLADRYALRIFGNGDDNLFVNVFYDGSVDEDPLVFGDIIHFTKGHLQALFDAGQREAASASVEQMPAPERKEYVHSLMHWMIKGDHVFVIQSTSLRTEALESYLGWLLGTRTSVSRVRAPIVLASKFDADIVGGDLSDIQELVIGGVATQPPLEPDVEAAKPLDQEIEVVQGAQIDTASRLLKNCRTPPALA